MINFVYFRLNRGLFVSAPRVLSVEPLSQLPVERNSRLSPHKTRAHEQLGQLLYILRRRIASVASSSSVSRPP